MRSASRRTPPRSSSSASRAPKPARSSSTCARFTAATAKHGPRRRPLPNTRLIGLDNLPAVCDAPRRGQVVRTNWRQSTSLPEPPGQRATAVQRPTGRKSMNPRILGVVGLIAALTFAIPTATATTGSKSATRAAANTLTVWLQIDAQSSWPDLVASTNREFERRYPGWTVDVQYASWPDHLQKFDATLAGGSPPDVKEMGNTEMTKYMAAG